MEHRRIASFGVHSLLLAATTALAAPSSEQAAGGPYRGTYVCQNKLGAGPGVLRVPIDLVIRPQRQRRICSAFAQLERNADHRQ